MFLHMQLQLWLKVLGQYCIKNEEQRSSGLQLDIKLFPQR